VSKSGQGSKEIGALDLGADKAHAFKLTPVSRETQTRLEKFVELLLLWQQKTNLISPSTIPTLWTRHVADSLQLVDLAPQAKTWVDFGSGGGFPAIPIACALADRPEVQVHLVESNGKKAAFLREAARVTGAPAKIHTERVEKYTQSPVESVDVVTARALAPLKTLCDQAFALIDNGAIGLFPKGQDVGAELTETAKYWNIQATTVASKTSPEGCILVVRGLKRRT
jgi:16S rRNA (guanine527-N7)-methyltransferase